MNPYKFLAISLTLSSLSLPAEEDQTAFSGPPKKKSKDIAMCDEPPAPTCCVPMCPNEHRVQVGGNYTYAWVTPAERLTTKGSLGGAQGIYEYRPENWLYAAVAFNYRQGSTDNDISKRKILDFDSQERFGYTYSSTCPFDHKYRIALFAGLGGRYMGENVTLGNTSVDYNYAHFYVPVGVAMDYEVNCWLNWGLNGQWRPQIYSVVQIQPLDGAWWILPKHIDNIVVDMPITYKYNDSFSVIVDPYFEWWHDGKSEAFTPTGLKLNLPGNRYYFAGVNVNFGWQF
ncbi:MAG: hypothetical protein K1X28_03380 [Parachlamydiales bacterium]|nr:hypothetical protein [Parachlamydiales bacterium]